MLIQNRQFSGEHPKRSNRLRNSNVADLALNCELSSGELRAIRGTSIVKSNIGETLSLHELEGGFISWSTDVDAVDAPIQTGDWIFYTGTDAPRWGKFDDIRRGDPGFKAGLPAPTANPLVIDSIESTEFTEGDLLDSFYVCTWVNEHGQEGQQSVPLTFQHRYGDLIRLSFTGIDAVELAEYGINEVRVYRGVSDVAQLVVGSTYPRSAQLPDRTHGVLAETLNSTDNYPPPEDMIGLHLMSNGIGVGFVANEKRILLTKNYNLHAWSYEFNVANTPVAVSSFENTVVVLTDGHPEVATIVDPQYIVPVKLTDREPCVAKRGVTQGRNGVFYPAPSGLIHISSAGLQRVTQDFFSDIDWAQLSPESFTAAYSDGSYYAFYDNGERGTFVFDMDEGNATVRQLSLWGSAVTSGSGTNTLYVADAPNILKLKGSDSKINYLWRSSLYGDGSPFAITTRRVLSPDFNEEGTAFVTLRVYADGELVHEEQVSDERVDRINYCDRARYWYYELEGDIDITQVDLAGSGSEMHTGS